MFSGNSALGANLLQTVTTDAFNYTFNTAGTFLVKYAVKESCCGWSVPIYKEIVVRNAANNLHLTTSSKTSLVPQCAVNGWTYYAEHSNTENWLFAINKNGNTFDASVDITVLPNTYESESVANQSAAYIIGRTWDVNISSGSINAANPVAIKFYVDPAEITAAQNLANAFASANGLTVAGLEFFKHPTASFDPASQVSNGNHFNFTKTALTQASTGTENGVTYYELTGITSFSGGGAGFAVTPSGAALPVELIDFYAETIKENAVKLAWQTATEINNEGFEIERSEDGIDFETIAFVAGNGNSNAIQNYSFIDEDLNSGVYYYRLKQIDYNGAFEHSKIVNATVKKLEGIVLSHFIPNPAATATKLNMELVQATNVQIIITDHLGRRVSAKTLSLEAGTHTVEFNTAEYAKGFYIAKILLDHQEFSRKLVIRK